MKISFFKLKQQPHQLIIIKRVTRKLYAACLMRMTRISKWWVLSSTSQERNAKRSTLEFLKGPRFSPSHCSFKTPCTQQLGSCQQRSPETLISFKKLFNSTLNCLTLTPSINKMPCVAFMVMPLQKCSQAKKPLQQVSLSMLFIYAFWY